MASLLSFVKRVANTVNNDVVKPIQRDVIHPVAQVADTVYHGVSPFDNGQGWTNQAPQRPQQQYQAPQGGNQLQVRPVQQATLTPPTPFHVTPTANLQVHVAAPQPLQVGNQTIQPNPQARTGVQPPPLPPSLAHQVSTGLSQKLGPTKEALSFVQHNVVQPFGHAAGEIAATGLNRTITPPKILQPLTGSEPIKTIPADVRGTYQAVKAGHQNLPGGIPISPKLAAPYAVADALLHIGQDVPIAGAAVKAGARAAKDVTPVLKTAADSRVPLNAVGAVGKNVNPAEQNPSVLSSQQARQAAKQLTTPPQLPKINAPSVGVKPQGVVKTIASSPQTSAGLSKDIQGSYNPLSNKVSMKAASQRIAQDPNAAYNFAATTHSAEGNATAIQIAKNLEAQGRHDQAANLMVAKAQQALQAGQGNQIYSLWDKLSPETVAQTAAKTIEKYNQTAKSPIPQLTAEQYKAFTDQAKNIQGLAEGSRARGIATQNLLKQIGSLVPSSRADKAFSLYRTGLLTGFRTPGKVLVSHGVSSAFEQAKNLPAKAADAAIGVARAPFIGKYQRGLSVTARGNIAGGVRGTFAAVDNLIHGYDAPGSGGIAQDFANNTHFNTNTLHGKVAQAYVDTVGHLHGSIYKPFFGAQHLNSLYDMGITNAKNAGLKGAQRDSFVQDFVKKATNYSTKDQTADPHANFITPEGAAQRANAEAQYTTFQNPTALSKAAASVKRGTPGARYIVPFSQIPSSIASKVVDYSPVGAIKEAIIQAKNGTFDQRALSQAVGRSSTGTGIAALGYHLYNSGNITTAYPTDKREQAQWKLEGKQANSIKVGGKWRQLASLGPAGDTLAVGANAAEGMKGNKKTPGSLTNAAIQGGIGGVNVLGNSPYLQGIQNVGAAIGSPGTKSQKVAEGLAGGLIPTAIANIASATDPLQRQTNSPVDSVTNKVPGLREKNLPQVDVLGRNIPRAQGPLGTLVDPFYSTTAKTDPVTSELNRLNGTYNPATPTPLTKNQSILGQKVNLNPKQLTQLQQQSGQPLNQQLQQLIQTPEYKGASDETRAKAINDLTSQVRSSIKNSYATGNNNQPGQPIINTAKLTAKAQLTLAKDSFDKSGKSYQVVGDTVLRRGADGQITATPKVKFDYQVGTATLTQEKNNGNLQGYVKTAQSQLQSINQQLADPSIDPLEALTLQNQADALQKNINKYTGYGGFTKGRSSTGRVARGSTSRRSSGTARVARVKAVKVPSFKIKSATAFKPPKGVKIKRLATAQPKTRKLAVSKMPKIG